MNCNIVKRETVGLHFKNQNQKQKKTETNKTALAMQEKTEKFLYIKVINSVLQRTRKKKTLNLPLTRKMQIKTTWYTILYSLEWQQNTTCWKEMEQQINYDRFSE